MNASLTLVQTLYFYDVPQLVLLENSFGDLYLCLLSDEGTMSYLAIRISKNRVKRLLNGELDLRDAYTAPESTQYYSVSPTEDGTYELTKLEDEVTDELLPDAGFILPSSHEEKERSMHEDLLEWRRPILKLGVCDSSNSHAIPVDTLSGLTANFSRFVQHLIAKRASKGETIAPFVVYGTEAASFNLKMYVDTGFADLEFFGSSVDKYLQEIGDLLSWNGEEKFRQDISELKGHPLKGLRSFVSFLVENKLSLKYQWLSNTEAQSVSLSTTCGDLETIQSILQEKTELERVILKARGVITKASIEKGGEWMLRMSDNKVISGRVEDLSILSGVAINTSYDIQYEDIIEEDVVSRKELHRSILRSITKVS